jgi:hypothetical protein
MTKEPEPLQEDLFLPPIFQRNPHLRVVGTGHTKRGNAYIKFINMDDSARIRELVVVYVTGSRSSLLSYDYSIIDSDGLVSAYSGAFGDPDKDESRPWGVISE